MADAAPGIGGVDGATVRPGEVMAWNRWSRRVEFQVEIWLRGTNHATTQTITSVEHAPDAWTDGDVAGVLSGMLQAIDRAKHPNDNARPVSLRGFSWIVNPYADGGVVIAIELSLGAIVGGPFNIAASRLDTMIARVLASEQIAGNAAPATGTIH